jgi:ribosomal protein S18 acetylase RimI-like enzyme
VLTHGYSFEYGGREAFIDEFYIEAEFRRQGFGQQAMQFLEQRAQEMGVKAIHLEVDYDNEPAMNLYRRAGYADNNRSLMTKWLYHRVQ